MERRNVTGSHNCSPWRCVIKGGWTFLRPQRPGSYQAVLGRVYLAVVLSFLLFCGLLFILLSFSSVRFVC